VLAVDQHAVIARGRQDFRHGRMAEIGEHAERLAAFSQPLLQCIGTEHRPVFPY
jgi:hypothetical protein